MVVKKLIQNQPKLNDLSQYNFENQGDNYKESLGLPKNNDKFQNKDLYTKVVGSELNNAIIERNLKVEGESFIKIDRLFIGNDGVNGATANNRVRCYMFSQNYANADNKSYGQIKDIISRVIEDADGNTLTGAEDRFFNYYPGDREESSDIGNALDNQIIIQNLKSDSIEIEEFADNTPEYNANLMFPLRETDADAIDEYSTLIIDENIYNPIYIVVWMEGNKRLWGVEDAQRKKRFTVFKINNLDLFNRGDDGIATGPKLITFSKDDLSHYSRTGDGDGGSTDAAAWRVEDFLITISTRLGGVNDWEGEPDKADTDDEKLYAPYFPDVQPSINVSSVDLNKFGLLNLSPDMQLNNNGSPGDNYTGTFPDYFPQTTIKVLNENDEMQDEDLQSYYDDNETLSIKASAPATIALDINPIVPDTGEYIEGEKQYFYFVIDWDDATDEIKTLDDWNKNRPVDEFELLELQDENLYIPRLISQGYGGSIKKINIFAPENEFNPYDLLQDAPASETEYLDFEDGGPEVFNYSIVGGNFYGRVRDWFDERIAPIIEYRNPNIEAGSVELVKVDTIGSYVDDAIFWVENQYLDYETNTYIGPNVYTYNTNPWSESNSDHVLHENMFRSLQGVTYRYVDTDLEQSAAEITSDTPMLRNTYTTPGIKTIKMVMFSYDASSNQVGRWKLITSRIYLDIPINQYPDFAEVGGSDYTTIPWPYTTPVIGGVDNNSKYKKSVQEALSSGKIGDADIIDEKFLVNDLENDELGKSINEMDLEQCRYFNKSYDINELLNINAAQTIEGDSSYLDSDYLSSLPFPQYFEEFNVTGTGTLSNEDVNIWTNNYGRPDIANEVSNILSQIEQWNNLPDEIFVGTVRLQTINNSDAISQAQYWNGELGTCTPSDNNNPNGEWAALYPSNAFDSYDNVSHDLGYDRYEFDAVDAADAYFSEYCSNRGCMVERHEECDSAFNQGNHEAYNVIAPKPPIEDILPPSYFDLSEDEADPLNINFNQYYNELYFQGSEVLFTPYTDTDYWNGDENKFPMESSVGQIFISDNQDLDLKQSCKLELNTGELTGKSIYDSSGNSNKGLLIGDYKVKKVRRGEPMRRDSFIKIPKKANNNNGAL